jgi:hypothetical protein
MGDLADEEVETFYQIRNEGISLLTAAKHQ